MHKFSEVQTSSVSQQTTLILITRLRKCRQVHYSNYMPARRNVMHWMFSNKKGILKLFFGFSISIAGNSVVIIQRTPMI